VSIGCSTCLASSKADLAAAVDNDTRQLKLIELSLILTSFSSSKKVGNCSFVPYARECDVRIGNCDHIEIDARQYFRAYVSLGFVPTELQFRLFKSSDILVSVRSTRSEALGLDSDDESFGDMIFQD